MDLLERRRSYGVDSDADLMAAAFNGGDEDTIRALLVADGYEWAKLDHPRGAVEPFAVMGQEVDPLDVIDYYRFLLCEVVAGRPVRDLAEAKVGYESALTHLRGAVADERELLAEVATAGVEHDDERGALEP